VPFIRHFIMQFITVLFSTSLGGPNIFLSTILSSILNLCFSLTVKKTNFHTHAYKSTGKYTLVCVLVCIFLNSKGEDKSFWTNGSRQCVLCVLNFFMNAIFIC
jgi:hypothetical protein